MDCSKFMEELLDVVDPRPFVDMLVLFFTIVEKCNGHAREKRGGGGTLH